MSHDIAVFSLSLSTCELDLVFWFCCYPQIPFPNTFEQPESCSAQPLPGGYDDLVVAGTAEVTQDQNNNSISDRSYALIPN